MKKLLCVVMLGAIVLGPAWALAAKKAVASKNESKKPAAKSELVTESDNLSYAIGVQIGKSIKADEVQISLPALVRGLQDVLDNKTLAMTQDQIKDALMKFQTAMMARQQKAMKEMGDKNLEESKKFLAENAKKPGVKVLPSGLQYKILKEGTGPSPKATDKVEFNYRGTLMATGQEFDNSYKRGKPLEIGVNQVVAGMTEALEMMKVGSKWEIYIPPNLGYKEMGQPPIIPPNAGLVFDVELLRIVKDNTTAPK